MRRSRRRREDGGESPRNARPCAWEQVCSAWGPALEGCNVVAGPLVVDQCRRPGTRDGPHHVIEGADCGTGRTRLAALVAVVAAGPANQKYGWHWHGHEIGQELQSSKKKNRRGRQRIEGGIVPVDFRGCVPPRDAHRPTPRAQHPCFTWGRGARGVGEPQRAL